MLLVMVGKQIALTQGKFALVDDEDYEWLNQWKWCYAKRGYATRRDEKTNKSLKMHRVILKPDSKLEVTIP